MPRPTIENTMPTEMITIRAEMRSQMSVNIVNISKGFRDGVVWLASKFVVKMFVLYTDAVVSVGEWMVTEQESLLSRVTSGTFSVCSERGFTMTILIGDKFGDDCFCVCTISHS